MVNVITNLGDAALLLPASALLLLYLLAKGDGNRARALSIAVASCLAVTILAKLGFLLYGAGELSSDLQSPSGHVSFAATFYGCCAALIGFGKPPGRRVLIYTGVSALIGGIAVSRVILHAHSIAEVLIGLAIGTCCWRAFMQISRCPTPAVAAEPALLCMMVMAVALNGTHLSAEPLLRTLARQWTSSLSVRSEGSLKRYSQISWSGRRRSTDQSSSSDSVAS